MPIYVFVNKNINLKYSISDNVVKVTETESEATTF